jgi:hypothetical protein
MAAGGVLIAALQYLVGLWWRTYDVPAAVVGTVGLSGRCDLASISLRGLGLVASLMLMFLFTGVAGSTAMAQRLEGAWAGVAADHHRLIRAGLAARGG